MYKIEFAADEKGKKRYLLAFEACVAQKEPPSVDNWDTVIDLLKKMKAIGIPQDQKTGRILLYDLDEEGVRTVFLEKAEYKMFLGFVKAPIWPVYILEEARDLVKWLEGLKHEPGSLAKDARPEKRRLAEGEIAGSITPLAGNGEAETPSPLGHPA